MTILYLSTVFELDSSTNNGDLLSDRKKNENTDTQTDTQTETDTLPKYYVGSSKKGLSVWHPENKVRSDDRARSVEEHLDEGYLSSVHCNKEEEHRIDTE